MYLIPVDQWYIIPYEAIGKKLTVHFTPGEKRQKYAKYLEAWDLLRGRRRETIEIQACVDTRFRGSGIDEMSVV